MNHLQKLIAISLLAISAIAPSSAEKRSAGGNNDRKHDGYGGRNCRHLSGNLLVDQYQLYPENLDFDFGRCLVFFG
jgi:hypothetical protein